MKIEVMYFGRPSEYLLMTSERIDIPDNHPTLQQVLNRLKSRGDRWAYELDNSHVICTVSQKAVGLSETIEVGDEIGIFSRKSLLEI
jgi:molybdopterin converting factor small subunit